MLAVLPPVAPFLAALPCMSDKTTLTLTIDAALARQFEAFAAERGFEPNSLMEQMIGELLFRMSPAFADPTHPRTMAYRMKEEAALAALRQKLSEGVQPEQLEPVPPSFASDASSTTWTLSLDATLCRDFAALALDSRLGEDILIEQCINDLLLRHSPAFADPSHPDTRDYHAVEEGWLCFLRGEVHPLDEVEAWLATRPWAKSVDSPSGR